MNTCGRVFVPNLGIFCSYHFGDHHLGFDACYRNCINSDHRDRRQKLWFTDNSSYYRCAQIEIRRDRKDKWNSTKCHWRLTDWNLEDKWSVFLSLLPNLKLNCQSKNILRNCQTKISTVKRLSKTADLTYLLCLNASWELSDRLRLLVDFTLFQLNVAIYITQMISDGKESTKLN